MGDENDLVRRICRARDVETAIDDAVRAGEVGDRALVAALRDGPRSRRVFVAQALRHARGPAGTAALREAVAARGPGSRDLRWVAVISLAVREREAASEDLLDALAHADLVPPTLWVLPVWADDRAWDAALRGVVKDVTGRREMPATVDGDWDAVTIPAFCGVVYLAKHAGDADRATRLLAMLRRRHDRFGPVERRALAPLIAALESGDLPVDVADHVERVRAMLEGSPWGHEGR